jgi:ribose 5-phosphate isomerase A
MSEEEKRLAGERAAELVKPGDIVGLGTGSTVRYAIEAIAKRMMGEGLVIVATPTSVQTETLAFSLGIPLKDIDEIEKIDIAIDGADEIDPDLDLIKGMGGALYREKMVARLAKRFVIVADGSKVVKKLGTISPLPVEVARFGATHAFRALAMMDGVKSARFRERDGKRVVTDNGNYVVDLVFRNGIDDPMETRERIEGIEGVLTCGLFIGMATEAIVADGSKVRVLERPRRRNP